MARDTAKIQHVVMICSGSDCAKRGAKQIGKAMRACAKDAGCKKNTLFVQTKCTGLCKQGPVVTIQPTNQWVTRATPDSAATALKSAIG